MLLADTFDKVRPSIVALGSKMVVTSPGETPLLPRILGTGFVVDPRGIVVTNKHVVEALTKEPPHPLTNQPSAVAMMFSDTLQQNHMFNLAAISVEIEEVYLPDSFQCGDGAFFGEDMPDIGFIKLNVCDAPALRLATGPNELRARTSCDSRLSLGFSGTFSFWQGQSDIAVSSAWCYQ